MDVHAASANRSKPDGSRDDARVALVGGLAGAIGFRHVGYVPTTPPAALPMIDTWSRGSDAGVEPVHEPA
ncbi:hypothetical protein QZM18_24755 [Burkholderia diffusa]|uniref:hypothetical protein n=1 Tax=Burkholderia diffusa TaxID=488732 RepID=UPI00264AE41F|nr:hypothetical protein [Burkholderia diffusa]MDN7907303.1 hypothetical protein [Burkholderia diffusa]